MLQAYNIYSEGKKTTIVLEISIFTFFLYLPVIKNKNK